MASIVWPPGRLLFPAPRRSSTIPPGRPYPARRRSFAA